MNFPSSLKSGTTSTADGLKQLYDLLRAVLPVFIEVSRQISNEYETSDSERSPPNAVSSERNFYLSVCTKATALFPILNICDPLEVLRGRPGDEASLDEILRQILNELEYCVQIAGIQIPDASKLYPTLLALRERTPEDIVSSFDAMTGRFDVPNNVLVGCFNHINLPGPENMERRTNMLSSFDKANKLIYDLVSSPDLISSCPERFSDYPSKDVWHLTDTLIPTISKNWSCGCSLHEPPDGRKVRVNLTEHQRFDIASGRGESISGDQVQFRVLFPATHYQWQDTEIAIFKYFDQDIEFEPVGNICLLIRDTNHNTRTYPRMVISGQDLLQIRLAPRRHPTLPSQVDDADFKSLENLLQMPRGSDGRPEAFADPKDCLILSFILTTFVLHCFGRPWLGKYFNKEKICFSVEDLQLQNITRPYFTADRLEARESSTTGLREAHRFPDILSLGILLLEIATGSSIESDRSGNRYNSAIDHMDQWTEERRELSLPTVPKGLLDAVSACLEPECLTNGGLGSKTVKDLDVRTYIFLRVLCPLGDALRTTHKIQLDRLSEQMARDRGTKLAGCFDHEDVVKPEKKKYAHEWWNEWKVAYKMFSKCQERYGNPPAKATHAYVKVAVLDTGLYLGEASQANFLDEKRIDEAQSKDFVSTSNGEAQPGWDKDNDGHGSRIGRIILDVAPGAVLHIAKVFANGNDLRNPEKASQVYSRIAEAIECATKEWKVDIIVMSFGFNQVIPLIQKAIQKAGRLEKPPLFFAATRNEAAHRTMAWPANDRSVIGISSTAGNGNVSAFNPSAGDQDSVLYAFGEGIKVEIANPRRPCELMEKYVSGTSYATAVAAGLAANLLVCVRMIVETSSSKDQEKYGEVPASLQQMNGMLEVLKCRMQGRDVHNQESLLPWHFLNPGKLHNNEILEDVKRTLDKRCRCHICSWYKYSR